MDTAPASTTAPPGPPKVAGSRKQPKPKSKRQPRTEATKPVRPPRDRDHTTGEAARFLRVSQQTVIRMVDDGKLPGYRVPGSKFRRIPADGIRRLLTEMKLAIPAGLAVPDLMAAVETTTPQPEAQG